MGQKGLMEVGIQWPQPWSYQAVWNTATGENPPWTPSTILDWACVTSKKSTREFLVLIKPAIILQVSLCSRRDWAGPFDYKVSDVKYSGYLIVSHTPLPAEREIQQMNFLVSSTLESSLSFNFHSSYFKYPWVNAGTVGTCTWICSGSNERKRIRSDDMKIQCAALQGTILNIQKIKNKWGFLIKIIIYPEKLHISFLKPWANYVYQQSRSKPYWYLRYGHAKYACLFSDSQPNYSV